MLELKKAVIVPNQIDDWTDTNYKTFKEVKEMFGKKHNYEVIATKKYVFVIKKREILIYRREFY